MRRRAPPPRPRHLCRWLVRRYPYCPWVGPAGGSGSGSVRLAGCVRRSYTRAAPPALHHEPRRPKRTTLPAPVARRSSALERRGLLATATFHRRPPTRYPARRAASRGVAKGCRRGCSAEEAAGVAVTADEAARAARAARAAWVARAARWLQVATGKAGTAGTAGPAGAAGVAGADLCKVVPV